jgi:hypothetical protein
MQALSGRGLRGQSACMYFNGVVRNAVRRQQ